MAKVQITFEDEGPEDQRRLCMEVEINGRAPGAFTEADPIPDTTATRLASHLVGQIRQVADQVAPPGEADKE